MDKSIEKKIDSLLNGFLRSGKSPRQAAEAATQKLNVSEKDAIVSEVLADKAKDRLKEINAEKQYKHPGKRVKKTAPISGASGVRRNGARRRERETFKAVQAAQTKQQKFAQWMNLEGVKVFVNDRLVPWLDMTVAEHEMRIQMLREKVTGHNETIRQHLDAVSLILKEGKTTLREVVY